MMSVYLVDYENVYIDGLQGMEHLTNEDELHIFYQRLARKPPLLKRGMNCVPLLDKC